MISPSLAINPWRHSNFPSIDPEMDGGPTDHCHLSLSLKLTALIEKQGKSEREGDRLRCEKRVSEKIADDDDHRPSVSRAPERFNLCAGE